MNAQHDMCGKSLASIVYIKGERLCSAEAALLLNPVRGIVDIWRTRLGEEYTQATPGERILSEEERNKANRFRSWKHGREYSAAHVFLRIILSHYAGVAPEALEFCTGAYGKPRLAGGDAVGKIQFNLSHSENQAVLAVTSEMGVGVDVEYVRPDLDIEGMAKDILSVAEVAVLGAAPENLRSSVFFRFWTRKEAIVKGLGQGLSFPLTAIDVSDSTPVCADPGGNPQRESDLAEWVLYDLDTVEGYAGALAVRGEVWDRRFFSVVEGENTYTKDMNR